MLALRHVRGTIAKPHWNPTVLLAVRSRAPQAPAALSPAACLLVVSGVTGLLRCREVMLRLLPVLMYHVHSRKGGLLLQALHCLYTLCIKSESSAFSSTAFGC